MVQLNNTKVLFIAGFGPIVRDVETSRDLYGKSFGITFKEEQGGYLHTEALDGAKSFALWPGSNSELLKYFQQYVANSQRVWTQQGQ